MFYKRQTYIARFWNAQPIRLSATCQAQAEKMAKGVAEKVNSMPETKEKWIFQSVGLAR